ncbi:killer cell lectin-like receptor subfamily F member 2 isoform X1 [Leopardus geoffroyi]|uniref:killer cell lectin-like receptor subfamily F member 2 isoform X1 n=1 Tax=Leopardus geoffroyi TaxID=46844 RepID=UPI001E2641BC|nr:killer cell lectin-like receptor subfamily F member 2 isoform X1 [Leopardus geoffroyi]
MNKQNVTYWYPVIVGVRIRVLFSPQLLTQYPAPVPEIDILMNQSHSRSVNRTAFKSYRILFTLYSGWSLIFSLHFPSGNNHVCPKDWLLNQGKCYRFSMPSKTWNESQHDCAYLQAHLPVIQSLKELEFIQKSLKPGNPAWIGLYIASPGKQWMWINKHLFVEENNFLMIGPMDHTSCAVATRNQVYSEDCNSNFNGICQRDAV